MSQVLLFCIAEEAKTFVRKALAGVKDKAGNVIFYLVESFDGPSEGQKFRKILADHESFETDFIGASEHDCHQWALEKQSQYGMVAHNIIAIADQRSASDDTLSVQYYRRNPGYDFGKDGILPREHDKWYDFRVVYTRAEEVYVALSELEPDIVYPVYYGRKQELTDERDIFNVAKAQELCRGGPDS